MKMKTEAVTTLQTVLNVCITTQHLFPPIFTGSSGWVGTAWGRTGPTFLDTVLQVVDDGGQDGGEAHDLGTLGQPEGEELVPAGPHQAGVAVLPGDTEAGWAWGYRPFPKPRTPYRAPSACACQRPLEGSGVLCTNAVSTRPGPPEAPLRTAYPQQPWVVLSPEATVTKGSPQG